MKIIPFAGLFLFCILTFCMTAQAREIVSCSVLIEARIVEVDDSFVRQIGKIQFNDLGVTAITSQPQNQVNVYAQSLANLEVFRLGISLDPFKLLRDDSFSSKLFSPPILQTATNRKATIVVSQFKQAIKALPVNDLGLSNGRVFRIAPVLDTTFGGGISNDGRMGWVTGLNNENKVVLGLQPLTEASRTSVGIKLVVMLDSIISADITNPVSDDQKPGNAAASGQRFFVFKVFQGSGNAIQTAIFLQVVDEKGKFVGDVKTIRKFKKTLQANAEAFQSIAVQPDGKYVLYTEFSSACGKEILRRRNLDSQGNPKGKPKTILGCSKVKNTPVGAFGLDIAKVN